MGNRGNDSRRRKLKRMLQQRESECWLCGFSLDNHAEPFTDLATEVDEEVPVSLGGDAYGVETPCHLVHRMCNLKKGNKILKQGSLREWFIEQQKMRIETQAEPTSDWL